MFGMDGGTYPLSEPESRAVVDAFAARPLIGAGLTNHIYRMHFDAAISENTPLSDNDVRLFERLARQAVVERPIACFERSPIFRMIRKPLLASGRTP